MKINDLNFKSLQVHLLLFFASTLIVISSGSKTLAQPGGCYSDTWEREYCRERRDALLEKYALEIGSLSNHIAREPNRADLYFQRGQIYSGMLLSVFGSKDLEFDGKVYFAELDVKAIADFSRAIQSAPKAEYFVERGKIYSFLWQDEIKNFQYVRSNKSITDYEIRNTVNRLFIYHERFQAAEKDFQKAIELSSDNEKLKTAREGLFFLRSMRANSLSLSEYVAKLIGAEEPADIALRDFDYGIEFYRSYSANHQPSDTLIKMLYNEWIQKGHAAKRFGRDDVALEAFSEAERVQVKDSYPECALYQYRAEILLKRANLDSAPKDVTFAIDSNLNCKRMHELRGDIYLLKGDLNAAIENYSVLLRDQSWANREFYLKRGKVYLQIGEAQKAIDDFTSVIGTYSMCEKDFQLRAEAFRMAGNIQTAEADEERARQALKDQKTYQRSEACHYHKQ